MRNYQTTFYIDFIVLVCWPFTVWRIIHTIHCIVLFCFYNISISAVTHIEVNYLTYMYAIQMSNTKFAFLIVQFELYIIRILIFISGCSNTDRCLLKVYPCNGNISRLKLRHSKQHHMVGCMNGILPSILLQVSILYFGSRENTD